MSRLKREKVFEVFSEGPATACEVSKRLRIDHKIFLTSGGIYVYVEEFIKQGKMQKHEGSIALCPCCPLGPRGGQKWEVVQ